jgi:hypothetical protein
MRSKAILTLSFAFGLVACGGAAQNAKDQSSDVWSGYKGTYASAASKEAGRTSPAPAADVSKKDAKAKAETEETADDSATDDGATEPTPEATGSSKKSKASIGGESVSTIGEDTLASLATKSLKSEMLSSSIMVGAKYERVQVQLKGMAVTIIRPAATPNSNGPSVSEPKARKADLAKTETAYYDADADVLVVVNAPKKASAQKALGAILKR